MTEVTKASFGATADGRLVDVWTLRAGGYAAQVLTYGGILRSLTVPAPGGSRDIVLGCETLEDYERQDKYLGALVGRVANRIGGAAFELNGSPIPWPPTAGPTASTAASGLSANLRQGLYDNIQTFSFSNIDKFSVPGLVTRMTTDVTNVQNAFQMIERMCVRAPVHLVFALFMAVMIGGPLSLIFVVAVVFLVAVLAGIMVSSLFQAGTSFIKLAADPTNKLPQITYWLMGSLSGMDWEDLGFVIWPMLIGLVPLFLLRWRLNVLAMGDDEARAMGVDASRLRIWLIIAATLVTAASVSVSGMIGWVGLVIPHMVRRICGSDYRWLMPGCMLGGGIFLLIVDNLSRNISTSGIPIGILTAFVGAPFFLLLITGRGERL